LGETGTGKELFARAIHECSEREGAFIPVNCSSITKSLFESEFFGAVKGSYTGATTDRVGFFEQADRGTIFLDEIGEMSIDLQARLLRVLQEKEITPVGGKTKKIDFILISATNQNLREMINSKEFREDLFHRINELSINIPPLRDRKGDILKLTQHFIRKYDNSKPSKSELKPIEIDKDCIKSLEKRYWRGNVRELEKACKLIMAFRPKEDRSDIVLSEFDFDDEGNIGSQEKKSKKTRIKKSKGPGNTKVTSDQVKQAMENNHGNKTKSAKELDVCVQTIRRHCKNLGI
jgi:transcriptional regulator with PAS, ATPase and Fis domain